VTPRASRLLRGALLGAVATLLAALSHTWAGGVAPDALALALGGVFASAVGTVAVGRRGSLLRTAIAVTIGQLAFHLVFSLLGTGASVSGVGGPHAHHLVPSITANPLDAVERGGVWMWVAHVAAGILTVLYLRLLERRAWALIARLVIRPIAILGFAPLPAASPVSLGASAPLRLTAGRILRHTIARRGPPLLVGV